MQIITRKLALEQGLKTYFTGKPCNRGHIDPRLVNTKQCVTCKRIWAQEYKAQKSSVTLQLRLDFTLSCAQCGKEVILEGSANGFEGAPFCRISDSYAERHYCGKPCEDRHYRERADVTGRHRKRYREDAAYRARLLASQAKRRSSDQYKANQSHYHREWRKRNGEARAQYQREWQRDKRQNDLCHRLASCLRHRVQQSIKHGYKSASTVQLLGASIEEVRAHLEAQFLPGMTWDNWTSNGWHIDHIRPCASFDLTDAAQQRECFHYTNLQPLWASDNCAKRHRTDWSPASA